MDERIRITQDPGEVSIGRIRTTQEQIQNTQANLDRGTFVIKKGHRIAGINPGGVAMEVPLGPDQIKRREHTIEQLEESLHH